MQIEKLKTINPDSPLSPPLYKPILYEDFLADQDDIEFKLARLERERALIRLKIQHTDEDAKMITEDPNVQLFHGKRLLVRVKKNGVKTMAEPYPIPLERIDEEPLKDPRWCLIIFFYNCYVNFFSVFRLAATDGSDLSGFF